ncbi:MAG: L-histidine N(alpha)-methyltransferase [Candidatus Omnitrophica bacterium]|nr:L-histidine N(alpha)-methyltransferase [Candidatus Omnitrophota bacterium]
MTEISFKNIKPEQDVFFRDVCAGLSRGQKSLPSKYFYDETGSELFTKICETPEYYPTRTELDIMRDNIQPIVCRLGEECLLIEYGSGNGEKVRLLLEHCDHLAGFIPIDISDDHLKEAVLDLKRDYPELKVHALFADFTRELHLPEIDFPFRKRVVYFPGSTIGNFTDAEALRMLKAMHSFLETGDGLLIGIDLKKDVDILERAYNDNAGLTARFNKQVLVRINDELGGDFEIDQFAHRAKYNKSKHRIEMHLVSLREQTVHVRDREFRFAVGETIHTENSHKYSIADFAALAAEAGFKIDEAWTDEHRLFGVLYFTQKV